MGQHISPFLFEGEHMVRVVEIESDPWFVGSDIAHILGHRDATNAIRGLDDDEKGTHFLSTLGGDQEVLVVSEPGVYQLVFRSNKPVAKRLKRWLAHEVIPAIRKFGFYGVPHPDAPPPSAGDIRPFPEWPLDEMRTKRSVVDMYRLTYGAAAAQWALPQLGFPVPPVELVSTGQQMNLPLADIPEVA